MLEHAVTGDPTDDVRFPAMRAEVQYACATLADTEYQRTVWLECKLPEGPYEYDFTMACQAILDDTEILDDPDSLVGELVLNAKELGVLSRLAGLLMDLITDIGTMGTFLEALGSPKWPEVAMAAREASDLIGRPDPFP
ncbi:MAG: SCO4402 family protein [Candidatus Dormibacteria bacterium]